MTADIGCSAKTCRCRRCPPRPSRAGALLTADTHVSCPHSSFRVLSPRVSSVSSVAATSHCRHGFFSDAVQAASSLVRSFPVHVPSTSSGCPLSLFSIFSRSPLRLLYCLDSHVGPWRPFRTSSYRRRTRPSLHAFIIFPALRVHIPRFEKIFLAFLTLNTPK